MYLTELERFWSKVDKTDTCWLWKAGGAAGYGKFRSGDGFIYLAHRYSYRLAHGSMPTQELDHLCRVRACVNPRHLEPVTHAENIRRGEWHGKKRTHCYRGHEFTVENTKVHARGTRECRACIRNRSK